MRIFKTPRFLKLVFKRRTWGFSRLDNAIFLTFDDGPNPEITPWVLDQLKAHQLKATFFCVGENVQKYPEIFQRILDEGHAVGNHTMKHENALKTKPSVYLKSIDQTAQWVDSTLFRPPYGRLTPVLARKIRKKFQIVMWTWLSYDFDRKVNIETIVERAQQEIKAGDILVLHDNAKIADRQKALLPQIIEVLKNKSLTTEILIPKP